MRYNRLLVVRLLRLYWVLLLLVGEIGLYYGHVSRCKWPSLQAYDEAGVAPVHVALVADPQIVDHYSYDQTGALLRVVEFYTDIYLRKSYSVLQAIRQPEAIVFLGDMLDGGREWGDEQWLEEYKRYKSIFRNRSPHTIPVYDMAGNHDIGIGNTVVRSALDRYHKYVGPTNQVVDLGGHHLILLDSLTLESDTPAVSAASRQLVERLASETAAKKPRLLFSHVPLWRPDGTNCGPLRQSPGGSLLNRRGYQFRDQLFQNTTSYLLRSIQPTAIFSGDDHDTCTITHPVPSKGGVRRAVEYTIGAFGWASGVPIASYGLLTLYPEIDLPAAHVVQNCYLPYQLGIYKVYAVSFVFSLLVVAAYCYRGSRSWYPAAAACKPSDDDLASEVGGGYGRLQLLPSPSSRAEEELPLPASLPGKWQLNRTGFIVRVLLAMRSIVVVALPTYVACLLYFYVI